MSMRERPILFNGAMVRAILSGSKTQTRRVVKLPHQNPLGTWEPCSSGGTDRAGVEHPEQPVVWHTRTGETIGCPLGIPGDRLWVKETWRAHISHHCVLQTCDCDTVVVQYVADRASRRIDGSKIPDSWLMPKAALRDKRVPSIHMPRWASRITLEITDVRVQRLQDISEADAFAEGALTWALEDHRSRFSALCVDQFCTLWESINGADSWAANPWVWALTFKRVAP